MSIIVFFVLFSLLSVQDQSDRVLKALALTDLAYCFRKNPDEDCREFEDGSKVDEKGNTLGLKSGNEIMQYQAGTNRVYQITNFCAKISQNAP